MTRYILKKRERHDAGFWGPWQVLADTDNEADARAIAGALLTAVLEDVGIFLKGKRINKPRSKDERIRDLEERLASAECVIAQVALDTFGKRMTVKEFAEASSYDS